MWVNGSATAPVRSGTGIKVHLSTPGKRGPAISRGRRANQPQAADVGEIMFRYSIGSIRAVRLCALISPGMGKLIARMPGLRGVRLPGFRELMVRPGASSPWSVRLPLSRCSSAGRRMRWRDARVPALQQAQHPSRVGASLHPMAFVFDFRDRPADAGSHGLSWS